MPFQLSPGVNVTEIDLTTIIPAVATSTGAIAGVFNWGPVGQRVLIDSETKLVSTFGMPNANNAETFYTAANFLNYGNSLYVVRVGDTTTTSLAGNTTGDITSIKTAAAGISIVAANTAQSAVIPTITNRTVFDSLVTYNTNGNYTSTVNTGILFTAKYPGSKGNSLRISVCDSADAYKSYIQANSAKTNSAITTARASLAFSTANNIAVLAVDKGTGTVADANTYATQMLAKLSVGDVITVGNTSIGTQDVQIKKINSLISNTTHAYTSIELYNNYRLAANVTLSDAIPRSWEFASIVGSAPGSSAWQSQTTPAKIGTVTGVATTDTSYMLTTTTVLTTAIADGLKVGASISGTGIPSGSKITHVDTVSTPQQIWIDKAATATSSATPIDIRYSYVPQDEIHVAIVDDDGDISGTPGTVLETFSGLSRGTDAITNSGATNFMPTVIIESSKYVWWTNPRSGASLTNAAQITNSTNMLPLSLSFNHGSDGYTESTATLATLASGYDLFKSAEQVDVSLILQGKPIGGGTATVNGISQVGNYQLANYIIDNIVEIRKDCIVLISPDDLVVRSNVGNEAAALVAWGGMVRDSSYAVLDSGYKYQYDRYNDVYRYIPLNGDIAGLCVRTDNTRDPWWSPAGYNRGQIKNLVKLRFNPTKADRDAIYVAGINPVVTAPGQGTVLFGDKTHQSKPSAFDRINVRRLFIVLEKAIATAAKFFLFEFNDEFTRAQFKALIQPYLRDIQGRRGITDFLVVCDATNNTPEVVDSNRFIGDIYIKPARSINFIQLNFIAVRTGVQFSEVVGKF